MNRIRSSSIRGGAASLGGPRSISHDNYGFGSLRAYNSRGQEVIIMKFLRVTSVAGIILFLGALVPAYAQREPQGDKQDKPDKQEKGRQQQEGRPAHEQVRQPKQQPAQQAQPQQPQQPRAEQPKREQQEQPQRAHQPQPQQQ